MNSLMGAAAEAPRRAHLYVGNLSPRVTEYMLTEIFAVAGPVQHVKIIPDRNYQHGGLNYAFVEYMDMRSAETALQTLNGRKIFDTEIRVNWAYQNATTREDTTNHYHVFVGDLSPEVNDAVLAKAFSAFGTLSDARVMWDMNSGKSRGYGFLAFRDKTDAEQAIATMNGEWLGSKAIRVNWANQKTQGAPPGGAPAPSPRPTGAGSAPAPLNFQGGPVSYEQVVQQTAAYNSTVYVGNLVPYCTQADLIPLFQSIGYLSEIRMQADRGFAFVKLDTHENAAMAIVQLQGQMVHGRPIKCSWGKDREGGSAGATSPSAITSPGAAAYGDTQGAYANYGQYGSFGYPGAGFGNASATGAQTGAANATADATSVPADGAAATGQAQWSPAAQAYYQNYWSNYYNQQPGSAQANTNQASS